jgi:hypothetical protein
MINAPNIKTIKIKIKPLSDISSIYEIVKTKSIIKYYQVANELIKNLTLSFLVCKLLS